MSKVLLALTSAALLALSGCADMQKAAPAEPAKPTISAEAAAALAKAQADVKMAKSKNILWTTAKDALEDAEEAAKKGDSATVLMESKTASDHVQKAVVQQSYPQIKVGD